MSFCRSVIGLSKGLFNLNIGNKTTTTLFQKYSSTTTNSDGSDVSKTQQTISEYEASTSNELNETENEITQVEQVVTGATGDNHQFKVARARNLGGRGWQPTLETHSMLSVDGVPYSKIDAVYIRSTKNNTIMNLVDVTGTTLYSITAGACGFKNCKKSTAIAGQAVGLAMSDVRNQKTILVGFRWVLAPPFRREINIDPILGILL